MNSLLNREEDINLDIENIKVVDLAKYVKDHKLCFLPSTLAIFMTKISEELDETKEYDELNTDQDHIETRQSIGDWIRIKDKRRCGLLEYNQQKACIFGQCVVTTLKTDSTKVAVIRTSLYPKKLWSYTIAPKSKFRDIFEAGYNIQNLLKDGTVLTYENWQVCFDDGYVYMENIKY